MKRITTLLLLLSLIVIGCDTSVIDSSDPESALKEASPNAPALASLEGTNTVDDQYLILLKGKKSLKSLEKDLQRAGGEIIYANEKAGFAFVDGLSEDAASDIAGNKYIGTMEQNSSFTRELPGTPVTESATVASPSDPSSAFFYARQWHHRAIGANKAWEAGLLGSEDVSVAILDGGLDYTYPDLVGRVDLSRSASFIPFDDTLVDILYPGRDYITDLDFHGTHVGSTVASNAFVSAGVTSKTTLMGVKVCDVFGSCDFGAIFSGLLFAAENGADVINMSLGGAFLKPGNGRFVGFLNSFMNQIRRSNATVVVSAGNDARNLDQNGAIYDAFCDSPSVICVSATGPESSASVNGPWSDVDAFAPYSNFGRSAIDFAAPGGGTGGPVWAACSQTSLTIPICQSGVFVVGANGTSFAAPHVTGLAALLYSQGVDKPSQVKAKIKQAADDLGQSGTDPFYGKGRINVANTFDL
jgi:subtilisin family serine protease